MKNLLLLLICASPAYGSWFSYDSAIAAGQKGDWQKSKELLKETLINHSASPDVLYDVGVACYKTGEYDKALSYFKNVTECKNSSAVLTEQAWFNAGNSLVALKKYKEAIKAYDEVLARDPNNKQAAHNKEIVKKLLEQQKQEQQKNDEQKKQDKQDENKEEKKEHNENVKNNEQKNDQQKQEQQEKKDSDGQKQHDQKKKDSKAGSEEKAPEKKDNTQKKDASEQAGTEKGEKKDAGKQEQIPGMTPLIAQFLDEQEKKDARQNKKMMKAMIAQQAGACDGQNNW